MKPRFIDDNLEEYADGEILCRHCSTIVGDRTDVLARARRRESPSRSAGPAVRADPTLFADRAVVLRQAFCPECLIQLQAEIVPADEPALRTSTITR